MKKRKHPSKELKNEKKIYNSEKKEIEQALKELIKLKNKVSFKNGN